VTDFWSVVMAACQPNWPEMVQHIAADADERRDRATYNTGSIAEDEAVTLLCLAAHLHAKTVIEIGTFIGTSTLALAAAPTVERVYTCDVSNDCLPSSERVRTYPRQTSTEMLADIWTRGVRADLCFFDGAVRPGDVKALARVTTPDTVYAVHDYNYGPKIRKNGVRQTVPRKGIGNVELLRPHLPNHMLVLPQKGQLVAALVPRSRL
jgi:predicted O-methyltransferase YrrM